MLLPVGRLAPWGFESNFTPVGLACSGLSPTADSGLPPLALLPVLGFGLEYHGLVLLQTDTRGLPSAS